MSSATPTRDWLIERRDRRLKQAMLPPPLRNVLRNVRRDDLAGELLRTVEGRVFEIATSRGLVQTEHRIGDPDRTYVLRCDEHRILKELAGCDEVVGWLRREARELLRGQHRVRLDGGAAPPLVVRAPTPWRVEDDHVLAVASEAGLAAASYLEGEPEGWALWAAHQLGAVARQPKPSLSVIGAGVGGVVRALVATEPTPMVVNEYDWIWPDPTELPASNVVHTVRRGEDALAELHDAVVLVLPSCSTSAASQHRRIYGDPDRLRDNDPSRLGWRRWLGSLAAHLTLATNALRIGGRGYLLVPTSIRDARGYLPDEKLAQDIEDLARATVGLKVVDRKVVEEWSPVARPFVGTARPSRISFIVEREPV